MLIGRLSAREYFVVQPLPIQNDSNFEVSFTLLLVYVIYMSVPSQAPSLNDESLEG